MTSKALVGGICIILVGCGADSTDPSNNRGELVLKVDLPRGILYLNDTAFVRPLEVRPGGTTVSLAQNVVTWSTTSPSVVSVNEFGLVRGVGYGTATVTAMRSTGSASIQIQVAGTLHMQPAVTSETWGLSGSPHVVGSFLAVSGTEGLATLTIAPGVAVLFREGAGLAVGRDGPGTLVADGSGGVIRFEAEDSSAAAGAWRGLEFLGEGSSILRGVLLTQCGGPVLVFQPLPGCLALRGGRPSGDPTVTLRDVEIRLALSYGFVVEDGARIGDGSERLSVTGIEGYAGYYPMSEMARFPQGGTFSDMTLPAIVLLGGLIAEDTEWLHPGIAWRLISDITVGAASEPVLVLVPGLDVRIAPATGIIVGDTQPGRVVAGSPDGPPVHLGYDNSIAGFGWNNLRFGPFAGPSSLTNVRLDLCFVCLEIDAGDAWAQLAVLVADVQITNARHFGADLRRGGRFAEGSRDLTITGSQGWPLDVTVQAAGTIPTGSYIGNAEDRIRVLGGELREEAVWRDPGVVYYLFDGLGIEGSATLTLEPGVRLTLPPGAQVSVGQLSPGSLRAIGTAIQPVVFTSSLLVPGPGTWAGVIFHELAGPESVLEHVIVEWAGASLGPGDVESSGAIRLAKDLGPMIRNSLVRRSATCAIIRGGPGMWTTDFTLPDLGNSFEGNAGPDQCGP